MRHTKQLKSIRLAALAVLALCVCVLISSGVIYARYRGGTVTSVAFAAQQPEQLVLRIQNDPESGSYVAAQNETWTSVESGAQVLRFQVSNGENARSVCSYDMLASLNLEASLGVGDPTWLYMQLNTTDEKGRPVSYLAVPARIQEGSALYVQLGEGWSYSFYPLTDEGTVDFTKDPLQWSFPGGKYTTRQAELRVTGALDAPTLLRLRVSESRPDEDDA